MRQLAVASAYGWLVQQGLWPTSLGAVLYWVLPIGLAWLGKRAIAEWLTLYKSHVAALHKQTEVQQDHVQVQRQQAELQALQAQHLETIATHLEKITNG